MNYSYFWSKRHYYVLVVSHFSHHFSAVALPLGGPLASFLILFPWMSFCQLWWTLLALLDRVPCSAFLWVTGVSHSHVFSLGCQHHLHWLIHQGNRMVCWLTAVSLVQCYLKCKCTFFFTANSPRCWTRLCEPFQYFFSASTPCVPFPVGVLVLNKMLQELFGAVNVFTPALPRAFVLLLTQVRL